MDDLKSKEDAIRILNEKITKLSKEIDGISIDFGEKAKQLVDSFKESTVDPEKAKLLERINTVIQANSGYSKPWTYVGFFTCILIILIVFVFVGYYKLYKPMADKQRLQLEKKERKLGNIKKKEKRHIKKH